MLQLRYRQTVRKSLKNGAVDGAEKGRRKRAGAGWQHPPQMTCEW
jgi:hypothetical protein